MRLRPAVACGALGLLLPAFGAPGRATPVAPGSFTSPNVEWLLNIPETGAIGARFVTDGSGRATYLYVSSVKGFAIYDVQQPELPIPLGRLPLPNFENEDIDGNENLALISTSPGGHVYVIDTTNKLAPRLARVVTTEDGDAHTANCLDGCRRWMYATKGAYLKLVDLTDEAAPIVHLPYGSVGTVHDVDQDEDGIVWMAGDTGVAGYAIAPVTKGHRTIRARTRRASPQRPVLITDMVVGGRNLGTDPKVNQNTLHSSQRPRDAVYQQRAGRARIARGGVLLVTEEFRLNRDGAAAARVGDCQNAGRFHTFDASGSIERGAPLRLLDTFALAEGTLDYARGEKQAGNIFCGAHWFSVANNVVALAMYGAGTRFLDVSNPRDIRQTGYFVSVDQETWASYWVPGSDGVVYSIDLERGIDVLRYQPPPAAGPSAGALLAPAPVRTHLSFLAPREDSAFGYACPLVVRAPGTAVR